MSQEVPCHILRFRQLSTVLLIVNLFFGAVGCLTCIIIAVTWREMCGRPENFLYDTIPSITLYILLSFAATGQFYGAMKRLETQYKNLTNESATTSTM